jgi:hypothetical protein
MKSAVVFIVFTSFVLFSCNRETVEFSDIPVIEAYLVPGGFFTMKIYRQIPFSSDAVYSKDDINSLTVHVSFDNQSIILTPMGDGVYTDSSLKVTEGMEYNVSFLFNKEEVRAYTYIPSTPSGYTQSATSITIAKMDSSSGPPMGGTMPDPVRLTWDNPDGSYYLVVVENTETDPESIYDFGDKTPPGNMFRESPVTTSGVQIEAHDFQYYGLHRLILYHVLPDYANLYKQNSTSSQNLTNPSTSIANGYGIFTGLNADTLYIEVIKS